MISKTYLVSTIVVILLITLLTACGTRYVVVDTAELAANLKQPCPPLSNLSAGDVRTVLKWATATVGLYEDCRIKHSELVNAVKPK